MFDSAVDERRRCRLADQLLADGATVHVAEGVAQARARAATYKPDALLLGALDQPPTAISFLRKARRGEGADNHPGRDLTVLVVLDREDELAVLRASDAGADDVCARSDSYPVVRARLCALLGRRRTRHERSLLRAGGLVVDRLACHVASL